MTHGEAITVGCDIGGTSIQVGCFDGRKRLHVETVATPPAPAALLSALTCAIDRVDQGATAIGVAFCGLLDPTRRKIVRSTNLPALRGMALAERLERRVERPVVLDADSNAGAIAEALHGAGNGARRLLYVSLGTGVSAALVVDGVPVRCSNHTVGQIAGLRIENPRGASTRRMTTAEAALSAGGIIKLARRLGVSVRDTAELWQRAEDGDRRAARCWRLAGETLGTLLETLIALWSPTRVVIGGGIAGAADRLLPAAQTVLERRGSSTPTLRAARLGRWSGALGAACCARDELRR